MPIDLDGPDGSAQKNYVINNIINVSIAHRGAKERIMDYG